MENLEQKRLGLRIKSVRILTGLNQEEFAKACDFNHTSLRNWEFGRVLPRKEAVERLIEAFQNFSIFVDRDWIFWGKGEGPVFTNDLQPPDKSLLKRDEIATFKKVCDAAGETSLILKLEDDEMAPTYCEGDWVGATAKSLRGLLNHPKRVEIFSRPMLVKSEDKKLRLRHVCFAEDVWYSRSIKTNNLSRICSDVVGPVVIHISPNL